MDGHANAPKDLVILVPDVDWEQALAALAASRCRDLGIRRISFGLLRHPGRDPGVRREAHDLLRTQLRTARFALVALDLHGSGHPGPGDQLSAEVQANLARNGWGERCACVVAEPELETWMFGDPRLLATRIGWRESCSLRQWLSESGAWPREADKPHDPKAALEQALRRCGRRRTAAVFRDIAEVADFTACRDPAFARLRQALSTWFPAQGGGNWD